MWNGEIPNFMNILIISNKFIELKKYDEKKNLIKKIIEAQLWIKKYLTEFSNSILRPDEIIGRNLNILISSLIHIIKLELKLNAITIEINNKK